MAIAYVPMSYVRQGLKVLICTILACAAATACVAQGKIETRPSPPADTAANPGSDNAKLEAAPGIPLPPYGRVWVLDEADDTPKLVRASPNNALPNRHAGENFARSKLWVMKEVSTLDLLGAAAELRISSHAPAIFIRKSELEEEELQSATSTAITHSHYVLLRLRTLEDRRQLCSFSYWKFGGKRTRHEEDIDSVTEEIAGGQWLKLTPKKSLLDGEYAIVRMPDDKSQAATDVYDFGVGAPAPPAATP